MSFQVIVSADFQEKLEKMEPIFQKWAETIFDQLKENPLVGKPLGVSWFREKKFGKHRLYFLIYEEFKTVYVVNISAKKDQQKVIQTTRELLETYRFEVQNFVKEN